MAKKVIPLYVERLEVLDKLDFEQSGKLFKAIFYYSVERTEDLNKLLNDGMTDILFSCFKGSLDLASEHYKQVCEKRRAAGIKGNEVRWGNKNRNCEELSQNIANVTNESQMVASVANTNTNTNTETNTNTKNKSSKEDMSTEVDASIDYDFIVDYWNKKTNGTMGALRVLGPNRKKMVRARIKEYGQAAFLEMIDNAAASKFMHGTTWASFEWCIRPNNFPKVLENKYEDKNNNGKENSKRRGSDVTATQASDYEGEF